MCLHCQWPCNVQPKVQLSIWSAQDAAGARRSWRTAPISRPLELRTAASKVRAAYRLRRFIQLFEIQCSNTERLHECVLKSLQQ